MDPVSLVAVLALPVLWAACAWLHDARWRRLARSVPHGADGVVCSWPGRWRR